MRLSDPRPAIPQARHEERAPVGGGGGLFDQSQPGRLGIDERLHSAEMELRQGEVGGRRLGRLGASSTLELLERAVDMVADSILTGHFDRLPVSGEYSTTLGANFARRAGRRKYMDWVLVSVVWPKTVETIRFGSKTRR